MSKPSLAGTLGCMALNAFAMVTNLAGALIPGGMLGFWGSLGFAAAATFGFTLSKSAHEEALKKRAAWRVEKFEAWLKSPWPELPEQEPWCEIDRAMGALLEVGVDPTYERAKDFLTCERAKNLKKSCRHSQIERFTTDQRDGDMAICVDCGRLIDEDAHQTRMRHLRNPFLRFSGPRDLDDIERALVEQRKKILATYAVPPPGVGMPR